MLKVIDIIEINGIMTAVIEGRCCGIKNGSRLSDEYGNIYTVLSVCTVKYENPKDISKQTILSVTPCTLHKGDVLKRVV